MNAVFARTMSLADAIVQNADKIRQRLYLGRAHWDVLVEGISRAERNSAGECYDEQLWTFALACAYAAHEGGPSALAERITGRQVTSERIWLEVLRRSPRIGEGETHLDLSLGDICIRQGTDSGIELPSGPGREIVFCEFKWYSDIGYSVSHAHHRNQLARVIENALLFRSAAGDYAERVHVALVTPGVFRSRGTASRLYRYKWEEYECPGRDRLVADICDCGLLPERGLQDIQRRLSVLNLAWRSYEELLSAVPIPSLIRDPLRSFYQAHKGHELAQLTAE